MKPISLESFLMTGEKYHFARNVFRDSRNDRSGLHSHDFVETFWVEEGEATHLVNGKEFLLKKGDITFIRPDDLHSIKSRAKHHCKFVNVAFSLQDLMAFKNRYFEDDHQFWGGTAKVPLMMSLNAMQLLQLENTVEKMLYQSKSALMLDWFLTDLFRILSPTQALPTNLPSWLSNALIEIKKPANFRKGSIVLSELSFKSKEHTSRVVMKALGKTPSQLVNEVRLKYASQALISMDKDIIHLAYDCGFKSIAQFYALFKEMYDMTPKQYQSHHRGIN